MKQSQATQSEPCGSVAEQRILDEIEELKHELEARQSAQRPTSNCIVRAYYELLDRQYQRLDRLDEQPK
jgi:hypothetical protein